MLPSGFELDVAVPDTVLATALVTPLKETQDTAMQIRPEVKNGELGVQVAQYDLKKAKAGYLPVASIGANLATGYSDNRSDAYLKQLDNNFYQQIGLTLSVPIFTKRLNN